MKTNWIAFGLTLLVSFAYAAKAQIVAVQTSDGIGQGFDFNHGWRFTVGSTPITVSQLGYFDFQGGGDGVGLHDEHPVGIWDSDKNLLTSVTVPSGTAGTPIGSFWYADTAPVTLSAGLYYIGAWTPAESADLVLSGSIQTFAPEITWSGHGYALDGPGLQVPDVNFNPGGHGVFGPNFTFEPAAVPEPSEYGMMAGLALCAFFGWRKIQQRRASIRCLGEAS